MEVRVGEMADPADRAPFLQMVIGSWLSTLQFCVAGEPQYTRHMTGLLEVQHLSKAYGSFRAVDDVSFFVRTGEIVGLLGPSGAGKTTTIHMLLGLVSPSAGSVRIFGNRFEENRAEILEKVSFTAPYVQFPIRSEER